MQGTEEQYREWLKSRPESVRRLAGEFPPGSIVRTPEQEYYVCGWNESDQLIVSKIDPAIDYHGALAAKEYLCAKHLREHIFEVLDRE